MKPRAVHLPTVLSPAAGHFSFLVDSRFHVIRVTITLPSVGTHQLSVHVLQPEDASAPCTSLSMHL